MVCCRSDAADNDSDNYSIGLFVIEDNDIDSGESSVAFQVKYLWWYTLVSIGDAETSIVVQIAAVIRASTTDKEITGHELSPKWTSINWVVKSSSTEDSDDDEIPKGLIQAHELNLKYISVCLIYSLTHQFSGNIDKQIWKRARCVSIQGFICIYLIVNWLFD